MTDCIFCKIAESSAKTEKIYEDDKVFVVLDIHPYVLGHCLVIPKEHAQYLWDVSDYDYFMNVVKKMAKVLQKVFETDLVQGGIAGVDVDHAHFHLFPRTDEGRDGFPSEPMNPKPSDAQMKEVVDKIKAVIEDSSEGNTFSDGERLPSISDS